MSHATPTTFELGVQVATPGALRAFHKSGESILRCLGRHLAGDWGDLGEEDRRLNDAALLDGGRLFSAYTLRIGVKVWVVTEAVGDDGKRGSTCLILPTEY